MPRFKSACASHHSPARAVSTVAKDLHAGSDKHDCRLGSYSPDSVQLRQLRGPRKQPPASPGGSLLLLIGSSVSGPSPCSTLSGGVKSRMESAAPVGWPAYAPFLTVFSSTVGGVPSHIGSVGAFLFASPRPGQSAVAVVHIWRRPWASPWLFPVP